MDGRVVVGVLGLSCGDADTHRDPQLLIADRKRQRFDLFAQALCERFGFFRSGTRQDDEKLFAAPARRARPKQNGRPEERPCGQKRISGVARESAASAVGGHTRDEFVANRLGTGVIDLTGAGRGMAAAAVFQHQLADVGF